jgi:hypothetical protein
LDAEETGESTRWFNSWLKSDARLKAAEARLATSEVETGRLRIENARLMADLVVTAKAHDNASNQRDEARYTALPAAQTLLTQWLGWARGRVGRSELIAATRAFLASAQPAQPKDGES